MIFDLVTLEAKTCTRKIIIENKNKIIKMINAKYSYYKLNSLIKSF